MRLFASVPNGRKGGKHNGTVNKNGSKAKKLAQGAEDRPLTIFPFSINDLQKPQTKTKIANKTDTKTATNKIETTPILACKIDAKPASASKTQACDILSSKTRTTTVLESKTKTTPVSPVEIENTPDLSCKIPEKILRNEKPTDKTELDAEKRIQAIVTQNNCFVSVPIWNFFQ